MQIIDFPVQRKAPRQAEATSLLEDELTKALVRYFTHEPPRMGKWKV